MKSISLDGAWALYYAPERGGRHDEFTPAMLDAFERVPALVPGNVELDLVRAGRGEDPLYGLNALDYAKYETYQWIYARKFSVPCDFPPDNAVIRFEGVDTCADVYLNGQHIGACANMFIAHEWPVCGALRRGCENELIVHIHSAMNEARNREYPVFMRGTGHRNEICYLRKAPHCFGWDIAPRLVSAGLWKGVSLEARAGTRLTETYFAPAELTREGMYLQYAYRFATDRDTLEGFSVRVRGACGSARFEQETPAHFVSANHEIFIPKPLLWWPRGMGEQPLYTVTTELLLDGRAVDVKTERVGLRTFRLERDFSGEQKFQLYVNNERFFAMGTNWVPLDALHSRDRERLPRAFALLDEIGCNMVRCWGGNVYESDAFYDLCDEKGVFVWQDFAMGNTNYPQTAEFDAVMDEELGALLRRIRNHPSVAIYSTDNEVDLKNMGYRYPHADARYNRVARETARRVVQAHDPYRFLLCSSPEIPDGFSTDDVPEQHTWGPRAFFKDDFYKHCTARFISEAGYHGCPAPSSVRMFTPPESVWPMDNDCWAAHSTEDIRLETHRGGRNRLMANQVKLFSGAAPENFEEFALLSQISQAEAMKFFVERARALKWKRTGIIWWNLIDCWPQISDSVVDYYFRKKLAYHYLRRAQRPVSVFFGEPSGWHLPLFAANDTREAVSLRYTVCEAGGEALAGGETILRPGESAEIESLDNITSEQKLLLIRFTAQGREYGNHYLTGFPPYAPEKLKDWLEIIRQLPEPFEIEL